MDEAVLRALARWPNVPNAYGWLALDRRGNWSIKGERVANPALIAFIGRNYACDARGRWFFQNGPQRVFASLAYTPFVARTEPAAQGLALRTHTGQVASAEAAWLDEAGNLLVSTAGSVALVHDRDLGDMLAYLRRAGGAALADAEIEALLAGDAAMGDLALMLDGAPRPVGRIRSGELAQRFGFVPDPRPDAGEPEC